MIWEDVELVRVDRKPKTYSPIVILEPKANMLTVVLSPMGQYIILWAELRNTEDLISGLVSTYNVYLVAIIIIRLPGYSLR